MVSYGDEIDVNDYGFCKLVEEHGDAVAHLVEEEDDSINWYVNPCRSDSILLSRNVKFVSDR